MRTNSEPSQWGSIALVSYVPAPLGPLLDGLRQTLSTEAHPQAHVTLLPPRPLTVPVETASAAVHTVLRRFQPFPVHFSGICCFPTTNVVYLSIAEGNSSLHALHDSLNSGVLTHAEAFEYLPHLTLSDPLSVPRAAEICQLAKEAWKQVSPPHSYVLDEVAFLWRSSGNVSDAWQRLWVRHLGTAVSAATASHSLVSRRT